MKYGALPDVDGRVSRLVMGSMVFSAEKQDLTNDLLDRFLEAGGLILMFEGRGVGLHAVDLEGKVPRPGDGARDTSFRAIYLLAPAETWTLRKDGTVTVTK